MAKRVADTNRRLCMAGTRSLMTYQSALVMEKQKLSEVQGFAMAGWVIGVVYKVLRWLKGLLEAVWYQQAVWMAV